MHHLFKRMSPVRLLAVLAIIVIVLAGAKAIAGYVQEKPDGSKYQAVFLVDRSVYFGKLSSVDGDYVTLRDVYQVQSQGNVANPSPSPQPQLTLSRLDQNNLTKPEQEMTIAKTSILFWENMQDDAEVVKKINELKEKGE